MNVIAMSATVRKVIEVIRFANVSNPRTTKGVIASVPKSNKRFA